MADGYELASVLGGVGAGAVLSHLERYIHEHMLGEQQYEKALGWKVAIPVAIGGGGLESASVNAKSRNLHLAAYASFGFAGGIVAGDLINFMMQTGTPWERKDFFPPNHWIWRNYPANTPRDKLYKEYANKMSDAIWRGKSQPEVRALAEKIVRDAKVDAKNQQAATRAIQGWVQKNVKYVPDPRGTELFEEATKTMKTRAGDCDDQTILTGSLMMSIGIPTSMAFVSEKPFDPKNPDYGHVVALHETPAGPKFVETILPMGYDEMPPFTGAMVIKLPHPGGPTFTAPRQAQRFLDQPNMLANVGVSRVGPLAGTLNVPANIAGMGGILAIDDAEDSELDGTYGS